MSGWVRAGCVAVVLLLAGQLARSAGSVMNLFEGLTAGTLVDGEAGWTRSEKDDADGAAPDWWVRFYAPEDHPPYLELSQDVWSNGPNLTVTRELTMTGEVKSWELAGRVRFVDAPENSLFLRILDGDGKAIASLERFTINHTQGKRGPGDSYLNFNSLSLLPKLTGKARWLAAMRFAADDYKAFRIRYAAERPEVITLELGDSTLTAPLSPGAHPTTPRSLQLFFGWGLGCEGKGTLFLDALTFTSDRDGGSGGAVGRTDQRSRHGVPSIEQAREKITFDAIGIPNAQLDMILRLESRVWI